MPKVRKSADKSLSQPGCSHSNMIYNLQLQKTIVLRRQPRHQPSNLDAAITMRSAETELQNTIELRATVSEIAAPKPDGSRRQSRKKTILKHFLKGFLKGKLLVPKVRKSADKSLSQPGCSHPNTIYNLQLQKTIVLRKQPQHQATFMQPFQYDLQAQIQETHRTTHTGTTIVAKHTEGTKRPQLHPPHARGTSHRRLQPLYTEKHKVSCSGFLPHNTRHATFMQPFQCDLQPQLQETHRTTHTGTTIVAKHIEETKRPQPHPPHTRGTFHRRLQPLYTKKHKGFMLRLPPHNTRHATFMQPFQCDLQPQLQAKNRTTQTGTTIVAKHIEGTKPFIAGCSHFTRKNTRFRAPASSPKQSPCNIHAAIPMRSASTASRNA